MVRGSFGEETGGEKLIPCFADCKLSDPPNFSQSLLLLVD